MPDLVAPDARPASPAASAYLDRAIAILRAEHINSAEADWDRIALDARSRIAGATQPGDTHAAIQGILDVLGEKHSYLVPPPNQPLRGARQAPPGGLPGRASASPTARMVEGRYGYVRIPAHHSSGPAAGGSGTYISALRTGLLTLDAQPICGWIVDLRGNTGGNMWPMLAGLDPLLGPGPVGSFIDPNGRITSWSRIPGGFAPIAVRTPDVPAFALRHAERPIAVLIDGRTASSGEMTVIALIGRAGVRTFGEPSSGYTTANASRSLSDGALLVVTVAFVSDRTGKDYRDRVVPDEIVAAHEAEGAAKRWLGGQGCGGKRR